MTFTPGEKRVYPFRPWVRRAGGSIVLVALIVTALLIAGLYARATRLGWVREPFVWVYIGTLWAGGLKVLLGTFRPVAEIGEEGITLRPLHQLRPVSIAWSALLGTEQMIGGDRLIVYHQTARGMRFVAMNLNLIKGRREFLTLLDDRLRAMGFAERTVDRSRYLSREPAAAVDQS